MSSSSSSSSSVHNTHSRVRVEENESGSSSSADRRSDGVEISTVERDLNALFAARVDGPFDGGLNGVDLKKGSERATKLVTKQYATSVANASRAMLEKPTSVLGLVFILIEEGERQAHHVVWQVKSFHEATQTVVAGRVSKHEHLDITDEICFPLSMMAVLIVPTLPFTVN